MLKFREIFIVALLLLFLYQESGCRKKETDVITDSLELPANPVAPAFSGLAVSIDKSAYEPGRAVVFTLDPAEFPLTARVRYKCQDSIIADLALPGPSWSWTPPAEDFKGYLAEIYDLAGGSETICATIGVDVSSNWTKFPRYGFLSSYPMMNQDEVDRIFTFLNRHHINGLQFYDWHNKHHKPLPLNNGVPLNAWKDIGNRDTYLETVRSYISKAHEKNIKTMFYNLVYGAWEDAQQDGVKKEWYVFTDNTHTNNEVLHLNSPFLSSLYLLDPSNPEWQDYIENQNKIVYQHLDFDGYHMDQLGDWGGCYTYNGSFRNLSQTYKPFIEAIKNDEPGKDAVMNAVNQYGQQGIAESSTGFLYTEVWAPYDTYKDLNSIIKQNSILSGNTKATVLAAYMNYNLAAVTGYFNTASVLMTDAVIFASGGAHLELGEHMLCREYFPYNKLEMREDLKKALTTYYDFLVAYQNLLRGTGNFNEIPVTSIDGKMACSNWPGSQGKVAVLSKKLENSQVVHLINFTHSKTSSWRDTDGIQVAPGLITAASLTVRIEGTARKVWIASPDFGGGASRSLHFIQKGDKLSFVLPELKYWDMIVIEY